MEQVLIVDDEPQMLVALEDLLSTEFLVLKTESPEAALETVGKNTDIAVVISDERMPRMPGSVLFSRIRQASNARRILITGFADPSAVMRAVNDGRIFSYITKPWDSEELKTKVQEAADQFRLVEEITGEQRLLHDLMDNIPDGIFFKDRQLRVRGANQAFLDLAGATKGTEVVGKTLSEAIPTAPSVLTAEEDEKLILASGKPQLDVVKDYSVNGQKRWVSETKAPIVGPEGEVLGLVGIVRDVTERVLMEGALRDSEAHLGRQTRLLNTILNSMREAVIAADRSGRFVLFNERARTMFGAPAGGVLALDWTKQQQITRPGENTFLVEGENPLLCALRGEPTDEAEVTIRSASPREAVLAVSGAPMVDQEKQVVGGMALLRDVTQQRALEQQLAQAQKMDAVGRLAGGVAHDFNNLLSVMMANTEFVQRNLPEGDPNQADLAEVVAAAGRAAALTRQLLSISRRSVVQHRLVQLNDVVENIERMLRRVIGANIELSTVLAPALAPVNADIGQLEQVLLNLTVNARDAMPSGGKLTIETANLEAGGLVEEVMLAVTDTGIGMSSETIERVFEPFFTTKEPGKGTGLGLATAYGIIQQAGGRISVESEPGRGTCFRVYLPASDGVVRQSASRRFSRAAPENERATVLLVEDDDSVRRVSSRILRARGHTVLEAKAPDEALAIGNQHGSRVDLLLCDVVLPQMTGPALAAELARKHPGVQALFMSGHPDAETEADAAYIQKPFSPYSLAEQVRKFLARV